MADETVTEAPVIEDGTDNPIAQEAEASNASGDNGDIAKEVAALDTAAAAEDGQPPIAAAPVAPVAATPATPATPAAPVTTPAPAVDPTIRQYIARLEAEQARAQDAQDRQALEAYVVNQARAIEQQTGVTPEQAAALARQQANAVWGQYQAEKGANTRVAEAHAKVQVAAVMAEKYKLTPSQLLQYNTPQEMEAAAQRLTATGQQAAQIAALQAEVAALKKGKVPPQVLDSGQPSSTAPVSEQGLLMQYNQGVRTAATIAAAARIAGG